MLLLTVSGVQSLAKCTRSAGRSSKCH
jgi:hypothetical protein